MRPPVVVLRRLIALSLLCALILVGVLRVAQGVPARGSSGRMSTASRPGASTPPRSGISHAQRRPGLHVHMRAVDHADRLLQYRVVEELVQRSTDGGRRWATILTPGGSGRSGRCHPARYRHVTALVVSGLLPGTLFVASSGDPGLPSRTRPKVACAAATGGLFALRPDGHGGLRSTGSPAGLPYAQGARGSTPRAYALRDLVTDPTNPDVLYADAVLATPAGPASPPAGLYRSSNGGRSWRPALAGLPRPAQGRGAPRGTLTLDPADGAIVFDVIGPTLYRSVNHGASWAALRGIRAQRTLRLFLNPANPQLLYALSDRGLYHSRDAGATWTRLADRRFPAVGRIRALTFDVRDPASVSVVPWQGRPLRLVERRAPAPPRFDVALALTPQRSERVVLAIHVAPLARVRLTVVGGAARTSARLTADAAGFGYASVPLRGHVGPAVLRVRVEMGARSITLTPWLPPGWALPGQLPRPRPTAMPVPAATATSTDTPAPVAAATHLPAATPTRTPTASPTATPTPAPTATPTVTPTANPAASPTNTPTVLGSTVHHYLYVLPEGSMYVYDIDNNFSLVKTISLPQTSHGTRGVVASPTTHMLYVSIGGDGGSTGTGGLLKYDLLTDAVVWTVNYPFGIDSMAITPDGRTIYMPDGGRSDDSTWHVIDAATGNVTGSINIGGRYGAHNTIVSQDGAHVYLGALDYTHLAVASTATNAVTGTVGPLHYGVRPFTINGKQTLAFTTASGYLGFQVSSITTGQVLYNIPVQGFSYSSGFPYAPSHGISLSPDEKEIYLMDAPNSYVHVFDVSGLPGSPPTQVANIPLTPMTGSESPCTYDCQREGWALHSRDGRFAFVGDSGDVIDTATRQIVAHLAPLANTRKYLEIDWRNGTPVFTTSRSGIGYVTN